MKAFVVRLIVGLILTAAVALLIWLASPTHETGAFPAGYGYGYSVSKDTRYFTSVEEMEVWLKANRLPLVFIADSNGDIDFTNPPRKNPLYDCDDYALDLQRLALGHGYIINIQRTSRDGKVHMLNSVVINHNLYFIEPQGNSWWFDISLD